MLPEVKSVVGDLTVLLDSGVRSGLDIVRGLSSGANAVFAGRPFLYSVGALGAKGGTHMLDLLIEETRLTMGQIGARNIGALSECTLRAKGVPLADESVRPGHQAPVRM